MSTKPICKKAHYDECRYEKNQTIPGTMFKYGRFTWYLDGQNIYFDFKPADITVLEIALDRKFNLLCCKIRGFELEQGEMPFDVAIDIINLLEDIEDNEAEEEFMESL